MATTKRCLALFSLLIWLQTPVALAQNPVTTLTGRVLDARTDRPLPFATVYLSNSSRGTTADSNGVYRLTNVPLGNQELAASVLGYQTAQQPLRLTDTRLRSVDLRVEPTDQALAAVTVTARRRPDWARRFRTFSRELLGNRPQARQCRIVNPDVLSFTEEKGHLLAQATEPLVIENRALGYRLHYTLLHFDLYRAKMQFSGTGRFEEMESADDRQKGQWQANRLKAYRGSIRHVLASLLAGTHEQEGYLVYQTPLVGDMGSETMPLVRREERQYMSSQRIQALIQPGELASERRFVAEQPLEVYYKWEYAANSPYRDSPYAYSLLLLPNRTMVLTSNGGITQSNGLDVRGYLSNDRLATMLPVEWTPTDKEGLEATAIIAGRILKPDTRLDSLVDLRRQQYERTAPLVYVHTDKALYCTGDQLWLSAYVVDPDRQLPIVTPCETPLQVELIAPGGQIVQHQWLQLANGRATASFRLADSLRAGTYRLRAYTAKDQPANGPAFSCSFPVYTFRQTDSGTRPEEKGTRQKRSAPGSPPAADSLDVQFLPEGGRWIAELPGRLGIKAVQPDGRGRSIRGRLVDQTGNEVARFSTNALGMGQVAFTPKTGQQYRAIIESSAPALGNATLIPQSIRLPAVEPEGWSLAVDAMSDSSRLTVSIRATAPYDKQPVYVTLQSREQLVYRQKWSLTKGEATFSLSTAQLPPGLCRLTLWDQNDQPRAERLVFVRDWTGGVQMQVTTAKPRYDSRERMGIGLQFRDGDGYPVAGTWSAAVTDADQLPPDTSGADMRTYLLLTSGLRGFIESPGYYLEPDHLGDLDNLLLTQGWRRLPAPEGIGADSTGGWTLSGRVRTIRNQPVTGKTVLLQFEKDGQKILRSLQTDEQGQFRLDELLMRDSVQVRAQAPDEPGAVLTFDPPGLPFTTAPVPAPNWQTLTAWLSNAKERQTAWPALYRDSTARQLAEVVVRANKPADERPDDVRRSSLHGAADAVFVPKFGVQYMSLGELIDQIPGISRLRQRNFSSFGDNSPLLLMDGTPIDIMMIKDIDPNTVSRVELLINPATAGIYGARSANGVIAIYSRKGPPVQLSTRNSVTKLMSGLASPREFYVPRYEPPQASSYTDRRDVLYWQPLGQSGPDGLANLIFPLSDTARRLRVVVQGLTTEGVPISFSWVLSVR